MSGGSQDPFCVCLLFFRRQFSGTSLQQFGEPDDRVERRPQFMAHIGEETVFVLVRFLQIFCLFPQFAVDFLQFFRLFLKLTRHGVEVKLQLPHFVRRDVLETVFQIAPAQCLGPFAHDPERLLLHAPQMPMPCEDDAHGEEETSEQYQIFSCCRCFCVCFFRIFQEYSGFLIKRCCHFQTLFVKGRQQFQFCILGLFGILDPFEKRGVGKENFCMVSGRTVVGQGIGGPFQVAQLLKEQGKFHRTGFCQKICQCSVHIHQFHFRFVILPEPIPVCRCLLIQGFISQIRKSEEYGKSQQQHERCCQPHENSACSDIRQFHSITQKAGPAVSGSWR